MHRIEGTNLDGYPTYPDTLNNGKKIQMLQRLDLGEGRRRGQFWAAVSFSRLGGTRPGTEALVQESVLFGVRITPAFDSRRRRRPRLRFHGTRGVSPSIL